MTARRELSAAVLLCLVGAFVVLVAAGRAWTVLEVPAGPLDGARTFPRTGADLVPGVRALGLVGLTGVVALAATRRTGRTAVGGVLLLTGAGVVAAVLAADLTASADVAAGATGAAEAERTLWPWLTAVGGAGLALAGLLTVLRGRTWPALGARYEAPALAAASTRAGQPAAAGAGAPAPQRAPVPTERGLWEALDRGEDPTATLGATAGPPADREADRT